MSVPATIGEVLTTDSRYQRLMETWRKRGSKPWWRDFDHPDWVYLLQILAPLANVVSVPDRYIVEHPIEFDQMIREWRTCQQCRASKPQTDAAGNPWGYLDCPLGRVCMRNVYLAIRAYPATESHPARWEWVGRHCTTKEARAEEIADRLAVFTNVGGGIAAREVEDELPTPEPPNDGGIN